MKAVAKLWLNSLWIEVKARKGHCIPIKPPPTIIYGKNNLGEFYGCILWRKTQLKFSKKLSRNSIVKNVIINAPVKVISINIWRAKSIIQQIQPNILHSCECGKSYNHRASLFNHKKSCTYTEEAIEPVKQTLIMWNSVIPLWDEIWSFRK